MHDIALLKQLTDQQLDYVIRQDPLSRRGGLNGKQMAHELKLRAIHPDLIHALLLSWAKQFEQSDANVIAADYYRIVDERTGSSEQRAHALREGNLSFLIECENIEWFHIAQVGYCALQMKKINKAFRCFNYLHLRAMRTFQMLEDKKRTHKKIANVKKTQAKKMEQAAQKGVKKVLQQALRDVKMSLVEQCLSVLGRKLTQPEIRNLRTQFVRLFSLEMLDHEAFVYMLNFLTTHGSDSEKLTCLNVLASRGETNDLEEWSLMWNLPLKEHHWKLALGEHWYNQQNGGDASQRVYIVTRLHAINSRYESMLQNARKSLREEAVANGDIVLANDIGELIGEALTLEELAVFVRKYGRDDRYQSKQVPFALKKIIELVHPPQST